MLPVEARPFVSMLTQSYWSTNYVPQSDAYFYFSTQKSACIDGLFIPPHHQFSLVSAAAATQPPVFSGHVFVVLDCELPDITPSRLQPPLEKISEDVAARADLHNNQIISLGVLVIMQTSNNTDDPNQFLVLEQTALSIDMFTSLPQLTSAPCISSSSSSSKTHWEDIWQKLNWGQPGWMFWKRRLSTLNRLFVQGTHTTLVKGAHEMAFELDTIIRRWSGPLDGPPIAFAPTPDDSESYGSDAFYAQPKGCSVMFDTGSQDQYFVNELLVSNGFRPLFMNSRSVYAGPFSVIDSFAVFCGAHGIGPSISNKELQTRKNDVKDSRTSFVNPHSRYGYRPPVRSEDHNPLWDAYTTFAYYANAQRHSAALNAVIDARSGQTSMKKIKPDHNPYYAIPREQQQCFVFFGRSLSAIISLFTFHPVALSRSVLAPVRATDRRNSVGWNVLLDVSRQRRTEILRIAQSIL